MRKKSKLTTYMVSVKINKKEYQSFEVPADVSAYIRQLEAHINFPKSSKLLEIYPDRFIKK